MVAINTSLQEIIYIGAFIGTGKEIIQPPEINATIITSTETTIPKKIPAYHSDLIIPQQNGWDTLL